MSHSESEGEAAAAPALAAQQLHSTAGAGPPLELRAEHQTLKYHLLGPSLTKAGQDAVDQSKVRCSRPEE